MAEYSKQRKNSALQELKRLQEEDRAAGIHYEEPELRHFDAQSVFEANKKQEPQRKSAFHIAKRSQKAQRVKVHSQMFENEKFEVEDLSINPEHKKTRTKLKRSQAKHLFEEKSEAEEIQEPAIEPVVEVKPEKDVVSEPTQTEAVVEEQGETVEVPVVEEQAVQNEAVEQTEPVVEETEEPVFEEVQQEPEEAGFEEVEPVVEEAKEPVSEETEPEQEPEEAAFEEVELDVQEAEEPASEEVESEQEPEQVAVEQVEPTTQEAVETDATSDVQIPVEEVPVVTMEEDNTDVDSIPVEVVDEEEAAPTIVEPSIEVDQDITPAEPEPLETLEVEEASPELVEPMSSLDEEFNQVQAEEPVEEVASEPEVEEPRELTDEEKLAAFKARQVEEMKRSLASSAQDDKEIQSQQVDEVDDLVRPYEAMPFANENTEAEDVELQNPKSVQEAFDDVKKNSEELRSSLSKRDIAEEDQNPQGEPEEEPDEVIELSEDDLDDDIVLTNDDFLPAQGEVAHGEENLDEDDIPVEFYDEEAQTEAQSEVSKEVEASEDQEEVEEEIETSDLYEEKKHFMFSEYVLEEDYLEEQSQMGYHYVKRDGKRFFFRKGDPKDYYYQVNYYKEEPSADVKAQWKADGWKLLSISNSKNKKDAGWYILRNEEKTGEYRKKIANEEEKFAFFKKYRNSCRSTLFLIFVCMVVCAICTAIQVYSSGQIYSIGILIGIAVCVVLFFIALIAFISYYRLLRGATKQANLLNARIRLKERKQSAADLQQLKSDAELDSEWEKVEREEA
ncbi:putative uncharacterized protein [Firmicutes bacterium CAG:536]|nr:putative uncharacterized protein [Firmicutes bacterium CAG:536]